MVSVFMRSRRHPQYHPITPIWPPENTPNYTQECVRRDASATVWRETRQPLDSAPGSLGGGRRGGGELAQGVDLRLLAGVLTVFIEGVQDQRTCGVIHAHVWDAADRESGGACGEGVPGDGGPGHAGMVHVFL